MKMSTRFAILAFGAASLAAVMISPASAQARNCSRERDSDVTQGRRCLTVPTDPQKDKEGDFLREHPPTNVTVVYGRTLIKNVDGRGTNYNAPNDHVIIDGPGYRIVDGVGSGLAKGIGNVTFKTNGGSGGKRGSAN